MLFNSFEFLIFFPLVTLVYFLLPFKFRWFHLLIASCYFYMAFVPVYILILFATIIIDYIAGIYIEKTEGPTRKWLLVASLVSNIGILAVFKYYNFFIENINLLLGSGNKLSYLGMILPIGLSFHTFQAMSYTIEVYRGNQRAERHFGIYALYVMFYPQLVAGPIERPQNVLHQFHEKHTFDSEEVAHGLRQMLWGFFKKIVIADRLAVVVNNIYSDPHGHSGAALVLASVFFSFQIYCDFSGYSDIALGSARVMGFRLMTNFNLPFSSKSVTEFWRRWHISLSTWFNDYLFNPIVLGLRNWGTMSVVLGLLITFFISGFWHGAGWKYIIYGVLNGLALVYEYFTRKQRKKLFKKLPQPLNDGISKVLTVGFITFSWIFFRAANVNDALYIVGHLGHGWGQILSPHGLKLLMLEAGKNDTVVGAANVVMGLALIIFMELVQRHTRNRPIPEALAARPLYQRWGVYCCLILAILLIGAYDNQEFIYFQF
ncbi:MBOAT family protein [Nemorincola caseinilytica]|uniref:MBOAT family protein n=1 Tax=Nemorincola caseinilytica TaxID=2054315 RepID=A0ABP8NLP1_9BACT